MVYLLHEKLVLLRVEPKVMNIYPKLVGGEHNQLSSVSFNYMKLSVNIFAYCLITMNGPKLTKALLVECRGPSR